MIADEPRSFLLALFVLAPAGCVRIMLLLSHLGRSSILVEAEAPITT
jgi:hypothetical protein